MAPSGLLVSRALAAARRLGGGGGGPRVVAALTLAIADDVWDPAGLEVVRDARECGGRLLERAAVGGAEVDEADEDVPERGGDQGGDRGRSGEIGGDRSEIEWKFR